MGLWLTASPMRRRGGGRSSCAGGPAPPNGRTLRVRGSGATARTRRAQTSQRRAMSTLTAPEPRVLQATAPRSDARGVRRLGQYAAPDDGHTREIVSLQATRREHPRHRPARAHPRRRAPGRAARARGAGRERRPRRRDVPRRSDQGVLPAADRAGPQPRPTARLTPAKRRHGARSARRCATPTVTSTASVSSPAPAR